MIQVKADVLERLKKAGYSSYRIRKENIFGQGTVTALRNGGTISTDTLNQICGMLKCQPGSVLKYIPDEEGAAICQ